MIFQRQSARQLYPVTVAPRAAALSVLLSCLTLSSLGAPVVAADAHDMLTSIVVRDDAPSPGDTVSQIFAAVEGDVDARTSLFRRAFGNAALPPQPTPSSRPTEAKTSTTNGGLRLILVTDADPFFDRWQRDANERLKQEKAGRVVKQHPLALQHPEKAVVVCEAGCRTTKDEIVYIAAIVPAVLPPVDPNAVAARQFEPSSTVVMGSDGPDAPPALEEGALPCIAGCYDSPSASNARPRRTVELEPSQRAATTDNGIAATKLLAETSPVVTGAITLIASTKPDRTVRRARLRNQIGLNGAIVERRAALIGRIRPHSRLRRVTLRLPKPALRPANPWHATVSVETHQSHKRLSLTHSRILPFSTRSAVLQSRWAMR